MHVPSSGSSRLHRLDSINDVGVWSDPPWLSEIEPSGGPVLTTFPDARALIPDARQGSVDGAHAVIQARWRRSIGHGHEVRASLAAVVEVRSTEQDS